VTKGYLNATTISTSTLDAISQITINGVDVGAKLTNFEGRISSYTSGISSSSRALNTKQDTLTAGNNITIDMITDVSGITSNIISAIGEITQAKLTAALDTKQDTLTAGNNITIDMITNTISAIGEITQAELTIALDTKQDTLTAGN
jgi:hypothetical protein